MTKKFLAAVILAFALVIAGGQTSTAEAGEVYVGNYSDGTSVYLLTHTIYIIENKPNWMRFTCRVRAGSDYLNYEFSYRDGERIPDPWYRNSEGYEGYVFNSNSPVAENIYRYVRNNY